MAHITKEEYLLANKLIYKHAREFGIRCSQKFPSYGKHVARVKFWRVDNTAEMFAFKFESFKHIIMSEILFIKGVELFDMEHWSGRVHDIVVYYA